MSRCSRPTLWAACRALATCSMMRTARAGSSGPSASTALQVAALDQPHVDVEAAVDFAVVMDRDDVRAVQSCRGVGFAAESPLKVLVLRQIRGQHLDGDDAVGVGVMGAPHLAHAAAAQQLDQAVTPERRALHRLTIRSQRLH